MTTQPPVYEFIYNPEFIDEGLTAVSIVDQPAIIQEFLMFNNQEESLKFSVQNEQEQILVGPALISGMLIYRVSPLKGEYYGFFSKETIKLMVTDYFKTGKINSFTYQHENQIVGGITVIESWFVGSKNDKSIELGYNLPEGSWMISVKVEDKLLWDKIKADGLKGFSVEVLADAIPYQQNLSKIYSCELTEKDVIKTKLKKTLIEAEVDRYYGLSKQVRLEKWSKNCDCLNCNELKNLGWCLPNVLPSSDEKEYNNIID